MKFETSYKQSVYIARHALVDIFDFTLTHGIKYMLIKLAWGQLHFSNVLDGVNHKISKGQTFRSQMWALFSTRYI